MSNLNTSNIPTSHKEASKFLGKRTERKACYETWVIQRDHGDIALRHFRTDIVVFHPDGSVTIDTRGYRTVTTKYRINAALWNSPWSVYADKGEWLFGYGYPEPNPYTEYNRLAWDSLPFEDGDRIYLDRSHGCAAYAPLERAQ